MNKSTILFVPALILTGLLVLLAGCESLSSVKEEKPLRRGLSGQGTLESYDRDKPVEIMDLDRPMYREEGDPI